MSQKKMFLTFAIFFLLFGCFGCDVIYKAIDKKGAEEKQIVGEILPFETNHTIEEIQGLLRIYGYDPGAVDGRLGNRTRNAIAQFQSDVGLKVTRYADKETWARLSVFKREALVEDNALNIRLIQEILKKAECPPGEIDGKQGPKTMAAIKCFQEKKGLKEDGTVGYQTLSQMSKFLFEKEGIIQ